MCYGSKVRKVLDRSGWNNFEEIAVPLTNYSTETKLFEDALLLK